MRSMLLSTRRRPNLGTHNDQLELMLIDDDDSYVLLVDRALAGDPLLQGRYVIERLQDGDEALAALLRRSRSPYPKRRLPDLLLLDHRMPRMDGADLLRAIRAHNELRGVPVCMMSTAADPAHIAECYALGATFCVRKPLKFEDLQQKLRAVCHFALDVMELPEHIARRMEDGEAELESVKKRRHDIEMNIPERPTIAEE